MSKEAVFDTELKEHQLILLGERLATHLHAQSISRIIFIDSSARPAAICLRKAWERLYPQEKCPERYFVNPWGFAHYENFYNPNTGKLSNRKWLEHIVGKYLKQNQLTFKTNEELKIIIEEIMNKIQNRSEYQVSEEFVLRYKHLVQDLDTPVMLFDTCMHAGNSMKAVQDMLQFIGFKDIRVGLASNHANQAQIKIDFTALGRKPALQCHPIGYEYIVRRRVDSISSEVSSADEEKLAGYTLRSEIGEIFDRRWPKPIKEKAETSSENFFLISLLRFILSLIRHKKS